MKFLWGLGWSWGVLIPLCGVIGTGIMSARRESFRRGWRLWLGRVLRGVACRGIRQIRRRALLDADFA